MLRDVKRRMLFLFGWRFSGLAALPFLPQTFYDRMSTITGHEQDMSASTRVAVWNWTLDYVDVNPWGGGFDAYRGNKFTYELPVEEEAGETTTIVTREEVTDEGARLSFRLSSKCWGNRDGLA